MEDNCVLETEKDTGTKKRSRKSMPFATMPARECTIIPESIWKYAAGQNIRRLTLLNNLRPYNYFKHILTELPKHCDEKGTIDPAELDYLMPWSDNLPDECRKPRRL